MPGAPGSAPGTHSGGVPGHTKGKGPPAPVKGPGINVSPNTILPDAQIADIAMSVGWTPQEAITATAIALAESGGKVGATNHNTNGTVDHGLWQINDVNLPTVGFSAHTLETVPESNGFAAFAIYKSQGWQAWSTYNSGAYKSFMGRAAKAVKAAQAGHLGNQITQPITDAFNAIASPFKDLAAAVSFIFSLQFLYVIGGGALLLLSLYLIMKNTSAGKSVIATGKGAATKAAEIGVE